MGGLLTSGKGFGRHTLGRQEDGEEFVRIADVPVEIRTEHFPNVNLERHHCTPLLCASD
jgi:hypothetical protein